MRCVRTFNWNNQQRGREKFKITRKYMGIRKYLMFNRVRRKSNNSINDIMWSLQTMLEDNYDPDMGEIMKEWSEFIMQWN